MHYRNNFITKFLIFAVFFVVPFFVFSAPDAAADTLGQTATFNIDPQYDELGRTSISATIHTVGKHAYFYIEDGFYNKLSTTSRENMDKKIKDLIQEFDTRIYPIETSFWGSEYNPGVDNDSRITILLAPLVDTAGGYFDSNNENLKSIASDSNQREMVYINIHTINSTRRINSFLAHEFQHLISFNQKEITHNINDEIWLNEVRSEYTTSVLGYNDLYEKSSLEGRVRSFLDFPSDPLLEWKNKSGDYAAVATFGEYLSEHYGPSILVSSLHSDKAGIPSINEALIKNNHTETFKDIFRKWTIANILNDVVFDSFYGYFKEGLNQNLKVEPTKIITNLDDITPFSYSTTIKDWQARWFWISDFLQGQKDTLEMAFSGDELDAIELTTIVFSKNGQKKVQTRNLSEINNKVYLSNISEVDKIIFIPIRGEKLENFTANDPSFSFNFTLKRIGEIKDTVIITPTSSPTLTPIPTPAVLLPLIITPTIPIPDFPNGSLLRAQGGLKVYIVNNGWKRHIVGPEIFNFYGHLGFDKVIDVDLSIISAYPESRLLKFVDEESVYELDQINQKRWLNISAQKFVDSGRSWDSIFIINQRELDFYKTGNNIIF